MRRYLKPALAGAMMAGLVAAVPTVATADVADVDTTGDLAAALDLPDGVTLGSSATSHAMRGVATKAFNDFPRPYGTGSYGVLSTGRAADLYNGDLPGSQPSTNFGGAQDRSSLSLTIPSGSRTPAGAPATCLLIDVSMGTEERVHYLTKNVPGDTFSVKLNESDAEFAMHAGPRFFAQGAVSGRPAMAMEPARYTVNAVQYWHGIDEEFERQPDDASAPLLAGVTPFDHFTSVETLEVPLTANDAVAGVSDDVVTFALQDENNNSLDTVMLLDRARLAPHCSSDVRAETGLFASRNFEVVGHRGVNNTLTIDLIPETDAIERYDAADNSWFPTGGVDLRFRWYRSKSTCTSSHMSDWEAINDADRQSFTPTIADKGKCILALVTGQKDGYRSETFPSPGAAEWKATLPIQDGVFTSVEAPSISKAGDPDVIRVNDVLTANHGVFSPRPDSYGYQWYAESSPLSGETGQTYRVTPQQSGKRIRVRVTASRLNFVSLPATSGETNPVDLLELESMPTPTIAGTGHALDELKAVTGTWQPDPVNLTYQWYLDGAAITGATSSTYKTLATQIGKSITVHVTGRKTGYLPATRQSAGITITQRSFVSAPVPEIEGTGFAGDQLKALPGVWDPNVTPTYQWFANHVAISGATSSIYRPAEAHAGQRFHVVATGTSPGYTTTSQPSTPVTIRLRQLDGPRPQIMGDPYVGIQLTADPGTWNPTNTSTRFRWFADGAAIPNATSRYFTLTEAQRGKRVTVEVTASLTNYETVVRESDPLSVDIRRFMTRGPGISGTLKVGAAVTAQPGAWLPAPTSTSYEWYVGSSLVGRGSYLSVPASAGGKRLRLVMNGKRMYYADATASTTSAPVALASLTSSAPTVSGTARPNKVLRAAPGYWGPMPVRLTYRWYVGSKPIAGATRSSYKVPKKYRNKKVRVRVTGAKVGYRTVARYSAFKKIAKK